MSNLWVCPWSICTEQQAQACRRDHNKGCGGRFSQDTTPEEAKASIKWVPKSSQPCAICGWGPAYAIHLPCLTGPRKGLPYGHAWVEKLP